MTYGAPAEFGAANWRCEVCETINSGSAAQCQVCNHPRPVPAVAKAASGGSSIVRWLLIFSWLPLVAIGLAVAWAADKHSGLHQHLKVWLVVVDLVGAFVAWGLLAWGFSDRAPRS